MDIIGKIILGILIMVCLFKIFSKCNSLIIGLLFYIGVGYVGYYFSHSWLITVLIVIIVLVIINGRSSRY